MNSLALGFHRIGEGINQNLPGVLTGIAMVGVLVEGFVMYKKAPKIKAKLEHAKEEYKKVEEGEFKDKAVVVLDSAKDLAPDILPPVLVMSATIGCIYGSHKESARRLAAATGALALTQDKLQAKIEELADYKKATKEVISDKKAEEINEKVAAKRFSEVMTDDPTIFDDADPENDCIFMEENSGTTWRDNYLNVMNTINQAYNLVHHNGDNLRLDELIGMFNSNRFFGNKIKNHMTNNVWVYAADDYYNCNDIDDFIQVQSAGFTPNGVRTFILKSNPTLSHYVTPGQKFDDACCGDGIWNSIPVNIN